MNSIKLIKALEIINNLELTYIFTLSDKKFKMMYINSNHMREGVDHRMPCYKTGTTCRGCLFDKTWFSLSKGEVADCTLDLINRFDYDIDEILDAVKTYYNETHDKSKIK